MAPARRKGTGNKASAAADRHQWKPGDLVLAKVKGYPAWPATVSEPQKWGYSHDQRKVLVHFFGTYQIALCNPSDVEAFTEEKKNSLLIKCRGKGADFVRAVEEIIQMAEKGSKKMDGDEFESGDDGAVSDAGNLETTIPLSCVNNNIVKAISCIEKSEADSDPLLKIDSLVPRQTADPKIGPDKQLDANTVSEEPNLSGGPNPAKHIPFIGSRFSRRRSKSTSITPCSMPRSILFARQSRTLSTPEGLEPNEPVISLVDDDPSGNHLQFCLSEFDFNRINNITGKLTVRWDHTDVDSPAMINKTTLRSSSGCDKQPVSSCVTYSSMALVPDENGSDRRSTMTVKENETCTLTVDSISANGKVEVSDIAEPSETSELNGIISDSGHIVECLSLDDGQVRTAVLKKKRKSYRKRTMLETRESKLVSPLASSSNGCPSQLSGAPEKASGNCRVVSGDEHLPLVKRARVRMEKQCADERELEPSSNAARSATNNLGNVPLVAAVSGSDDNHIAFNSMVLDKESDTSHLVASGNAEPKESGNLLPWKAKKHHLIGSVDAEAALPPSKRLHRALEAMSANVAEAADTCIELQDGEHQKGIEAQGSLESEIHNLHKPHEVVKSNNDASGVSVNSNVAELPVETCSEDKLHNRNVESHGSLPHESIVNMTSKCAKDEDERSDAVNHEIHDSSEINHSPTQGRLIDSSFLIQQDAVCLQNRTKSTLMADTVVIDKSTINVGNEQFVNAQTQAANPVEECHCKHLSVKGITSAPTDTGYGNVSLVINGDEDSSSYSRTNSGKTVVCIKSLYNESAGVVDVKYTRNELKLTPKAEGADPVSEWKPMSDLAAVQSKLKIPHSSPLLNLCSSDSKPYRCETVHTLSLVASDDVRHHPCSDVSGSSEGKSLHALNSEDVSVEQQGCGTQFSEKLCERSKIKSALKSFEALLLTLSRTKESIGRATRVAIDCAKYDIASEVVDLLLERLEIEPSLQRRVDLFFLVDSITQCSRGQKGTAGSSYSSAVQAMLPRLLTAAAPPGNAAHENRKQCLKVLKLWLERKTLPESIVRRHIQELDCVNEGSILQRRPLRTERALNDPLREMDGMLVDEYGSNTSFHIHGLSIPCLLEEEEELCSSDEKSNKTPTSEEICKIPEGSKGIVKAASGKHRHILEDVDGELEMEDVSPSYDTDIAVCNFSIGERMISSTNQSDKYHPLPVSQPPLPEEVPPSPPPLPSSPPPPALPPTPFLPPSLLIPSSVSHSFSELDLRPHENNYQNKFPRQFVQQQSVENVSGTHSHNSAHVHPGYMDPQIGMQHGPSFGPSCPYAGSHAAHMPMQSGNTVQQMIGGPQLHNKNLPLRPPACAVSNQFSFLHSEPPQQLQSWPCGSSSTFQGQCQSMHSIPGESLKDDGSRMRSFSTLMDGGCRFAATSDSGSQKTGPVNGHASYYWPRENTNQWRSSSIVGSDYYQNRHSYLASAQRQVPGVTGSPAPSFWRPS